MKNIFLGRLALAEKVHGATKHSDALDETAKRLLEVIALSYAQNRPLTVSAARALEPITSPHTPHRKLGLLHKLRQIYGQMFFDRKN